MFFEMTAAESASSDRRLLSITLIGCLFLIVGCAGFAAGAMGFFIATLRPDVATLRPHTASESAWTTASGLVALAGGWYVLRGSQFGRALVIFWMAAHIVLSAMHSWEKLIVHCVIFTVIGYFLLRPSASSFFRPKRSVQA